MICLVKIKEKKTSMSSSPADSHQHSDSITKKHSLLTCYSQGLASGNVHHLWKASKSKASVWEDLIICVHICGSQLNTVNEENLISR